MLLAVPVASAATLTNVGVQGATKTTGLSETWTITFRTVGAVGTGGDVRVVFPPGFVTSSPAASVCDIAGMTGEAATVVSTTEVVCELVGNSIGATTDVSMTLTNIRNPLTVQTTGVFLIQTRSLLDVLIDDHLTATASITASTLGSVSLSAPLQTSGAIETWTTTFTTVSSLDSADEVRVVLPTGFSTSGGTTCAFTAPVTALGGTVTIVSATEVVCELDALATVPAATVTTVTFSNIQNPATEQTTGVFTLQTRVTGGAVHDEHLTNLESIAVSALTAVSASAPLQTTGTVETWTIGFTTFNAVGANGDVRIVLPAGFATGPGPATACDIAGETVESTTVVSATEVTCDLNGATFGAAEAITLTSTNVKNPSTVQTTGAFTVETRDTSNARHDTDATNTEAITASTLSGPAVSAPLQTTGSVETWTVAFTAVNAVGADGDIRMVFPGGFETGSGAATVCDVAGETLESTNVVSSTEVVCELNGATLAASEAVSLTLTNIKNPTISGTTIAFTIQTRDSADVVHDQHTANTESILASTLTSVDAAAAQTTGAVGTWTITFTTVNPVAADGDVRIVFPADFQTSSGIPTVCTITGKSGVLTNVVSATEVVCDLGPLASFGASEPVTVSLTNIKNPTTVRTTGAFTLQTRDPAGVVHDAHATHTESITASTLAALDVLAPLQRTSAVETWTVAFTTVNPVAADGDVRIVFPAGFVTSSGATTVCDIAGKTGETTTVVSSTQVVCNLNSVTFAAGEPISLTLTNVKNPGSAQTTGAFTVATRDSTDAVHDQHTTNTEAIVPFGLTSVAVSAPLQTAGAVETWTFAVTSTDGTAADGDLRFVFPAGFQTSSGAASVCDVAAKTGETTTVVSATEIVCNLPGLAVAASETLTVTLTRIKNPTSAQTTGAFTIQLRDAADVLVEESTDDTESISANTLSSVSIRAPTQYAGRVETWTVSFVTVNPVAASGDIRVYFPQGFEASYAAATVCDISGKTGETTSVVSANEVVCDLGAGTTIGAGESVTVTFTNVRNPILAQTTDAFTVQTRSSSDVAHDQHLSNTETILASSVSGVSLAAPLQSAGAVETWTVLVRPGTLFPAGSDVRVAFPAGFEVSSGGATECDVTGKTGETAVVLSPTDVACEFGSFALDPDQTYTITFSRIKNPTSARTTGVFTVQLRNSGDVVIEQHLTNTEAIVAHAFLATPTASPSRADAAEVVSLTVEIQLFNDWPSDGKLKIVLPAGMAANAAGAGSTAASGLTGATGTLGAPTVSGSTLTFTRVGGSLALSGTVIKVSVSNLRNPAPAGTSGTFSLATMEIGGAEIDAGSAAAYALIGGTVPAPPAPPIVPPQEPPENETDDPVDDAPAPEGERLIPIRIGAAPSAPLFGILVMMALAVALARRRGRFGDEP